MAIVNRPHREELWGISSDVLCHSKTHKECWLPHEAEALPVWPEFVGSVVYQKNGYVEHNSYYLYAFELPLEGTLRLIERDSETMIEPGMVGIIHRGEDSRLDTQEENGCRKLAVGMRGVALGSIIAAAGLSGRLAVRARDPEKLFGLVLRLESLLGLRQPADIPAIAGIGMANSRKSTQSPKPKRQVGGRTLSQQSKRFPHASSSASRLPYLLLR